MSPNIFVFKLFSKPFITLLTVNKAISPMAIPAIEKNEINDINAFPLEERLYLSPINKLTG
ncbi:hypothetical protein PAT01_01430 [Pseudoalteromonas atlantica]|uniref:Uncharacterized protein n=1 Tax=Pseudoalteromonas atlantica TaxID=288 RepID=A0ABQ0UCX1_PSEAF|nr:hypothetical protein PAT01_01430 [Pseudoalteromonas atlantica]